MSTCGEPCDGCANRAEHHLCDACCQDEVDVIRREERELREKLEFQAAATKALLESTERLAGELKEARIEVDRLAVQLKEARAECARQMAYGVKQHEAAQEAIRERDEAQAWAKERSEFAAAETEHANRWSVRAHKAEAEVKRLRGLTPEFPPRPPDGDGLPRYGLRWNGPVEPIAVPMDDGYWTPWHLADAAYRRGAEAMREAIAERFDRLFAGDRFHDDLPDHVRTTPIPEDK